MRAADNWQPIDYAKAACDTMMRKFQAAELPPKGKFHYHQGVFLSGLYQTYMLCKEEKYYQYMKDWVDSIIDEQGEIHTFDPNMLDDIQPGILLFPLLSRTADQRYRKALDTLLPVIRDFPRNAVGGFWHKVYHPNQMWLDGLYMAGPIAVEYGKVFDQPEYIEISIEQALLMQEKTLDKETGLLYHAWDCSKKAPWADKETGLSSEFWGRSIGWVPVAVLDELDFIAQDHPKRPALEKMVTDLLKALCNFQSAEGRWYQVVNKGEREGNWLENSCSCLYTAAICKAVRTGLLDASYLACAKRAYEAVIRSLEFQGEDIRIGNICVGTSVGNFQYYCDRPVSENDLHGVGAFLIMCAQAQHAFQ